SVHRIGSYPQREPTQGARFRRLVMSLRPRRYRMNPNPSTQRGAALFVSLIMLVLITLFVLAAINMSTVNLRITANSQARSEAIAAAQQAIEQVASRNFTANPQAATV